MLFKIPFVRISPYLFLHLYLRKRMVLEAQVMCFLHLALFSMTKYLICNIYSEAVLEKDKGGNCAIPRPYFIVLSHSTFTFQIASIKTWWSPKTRMLSVIFSADDETVTDSDQPAQDPADPGLATTLYKLSFVERRAVMLTLLKSLVQPNLDYCSQIWSPSDQRSINKLEAVQQHLVDRIHDRRLSGLNYWEKLEELHLFSQETRRERYMLIFLWKISQGLASGYGVNFTSEGLRRGRIIIPNVVNRGAPKMVQNARERSLGVRGALLFNLLPDNLRTMNTGHIDFFKNHLDVFLSTIPDQPTMTGQGRAAEMNSLIHQLPLFYNQTR